MKQNEYDNIENVSPTSLTNVFDVYSDSSLGSNTLSYSINKTLNLLNVDKLPKTNYTIHYWVGKDTLTGIAHKYYDDYSLWWLVAKVNDIHNPFEDIAVGTELKIINNNIVRNILEQVRRS